MLQLNNLSKQEAISLISLKLNKTPAIKRNSADVALYLDISGSMDNKRAMIDPIMKLMLTFASELDSNGNLRYYHYNNTIRKQPGLTMQDFNTKFSIDPNGGTATDLCVRNEIPSKVENMFSMFKKAPEKKVIFIITDGEPNDEDELIEAIAAAEKHDIFIQFICLGRVLLLEGEKSPKVDTKKFEGEELTGMTNESFVNKVISDDLAAFLSK